MVTELGASEAFLSNVAAPEIIHRAFRQAHAKRRLAHAYLFVGPSGSGRRAFASGLAKALLCRTGEPCGSCPACRSVDHGNHPGLEIFETGRKSASVDIGAVRELARRDTRKHLDLRIWIIEDCERIAPAAANALLKTLEEPHPGTLLILLAPSTGSILPTLVSRCQRVQFPAPRDDRASSENAESQPISFEDLKQVLDPAFFAERDPKAWLTALSPVETVRGSLSDVLDQTIVRLRGDWKRLEHGGRVAGSDPLIALQGLIAIRGDLDGNLHADLAAERIVLQLRSPHARGLFVD